MVNIKRVNDRLIYIKPVVGGHTLSMISSYALQASLDKEVKNHFWEDLDEVVRGISHTGKLFIGGDFNCYIGEKSDRGLCIDCKIILSEWILTQHRLLVLELEIMRERKRSAVYWKPKIKCGTLTKDKAQYQGRSCWL
uniref:Uncharacterized protein LOC104230761 n=1 Tax=Nicotiana sylvestris TaxID=4096 RepID=A0A1U7X4X9_NICSY|nr:PREDICTED: uncharacterized protein LOC104230761 [Nicotiana sylvestris]